MQKTNARLQSPEHPVNRLIAALGEFRRIDAEFPMQYAICLLEIARNEGLSLTELAERTNMALSTVSRVVGALSDYRSNGQPFELITMQISAEERRRKELYLSDRGKKLISALEKVISA
ncbi:MAG: winged helix-turn-helix transcriptional regulator [Pseudobdellovibrionaceae bacterium]